MIHRVTRTGGIEALRCPLARPGDLLVILRRRPRAHCPLSRNSRAHSSGSREPPRGKPETALRLQNRSIVFGRCSANSPLTMETPSATIRCTADVLHPLRCRTPPDESCPMNLGGFGLRTAGSEPPCLAATAMAGRRGDRFGDRRSNSTPASSQDADLRPRPGAGIRRARGRSSERRRHLESTVQARPAAAAVAQADAPSASPCRRMPSGRARRLHCSPAHAGASTSPDVAAAVAAAVHPQTRSSAIQTPTLSYDPAENLPS